MSNKIIADRDERNSYYDSVINFDNLTTDALVIATTDAIEADEGHLAQLDSIISDTEQDLNMGIVIADAIMSVSDAGVTIDSTKVDQAMMIATGIADKADMDSIGGISGGQILASFIKMNIYTILSADVPFCGDIADLVPVNGSKDNVKFQVIGIDPIVTGAMGDFVAGDNISGVNAGNAFAISEREDSQVTVTDTLTYTFNLKAKAADLQNTKMERGTNEVVVNSGLYLNDYDVSSGETTATRVLVDGGITYTAVFDYADGSITLTLSDNVDEGTVIIFNGALSADVLSDITGTIESEITDYTYVAMPVSLDTKVNTLKARQVLQSTGLNLLSTDLSVALSKISEEIKAKKIKKSLAFAKPFGALVDLAAADESSIADKYRHAVIRVEEARSEIIVKSGITSNVVLVGGSGLVTLFTGLTTDAGRGSVQTNENGIRFLGYINNTIACYFNPLHDAQYPVTGTTHQIFVVGNPSDATKKAAVFGVGLPILPDEIGKDMDSNKVTRLLGKVVVASNKDAHTKELVKKIQVKF